MPPSGTTSSSHQYHLRRGAFRIDVLLAGNDGTTDNGVIVELKAWDTAGFSTIVDLVHSPIGGGTLKQHPCVQARSYKGLITRFNQDIRERGIGLHSAAYLFNLHRRNPEPLEDPRYHGILADTKLFLAGDVEELKRYIEKLVPKKPKQDVLFYLENGRLKPSPELVTRVHHMLEGNEEFHLIDEQNEAFQIIRHEVMSAKSLAERHVFVVQGGPGTGKSVIAVRLLADILKGGRAGFFRAPNAAFRNTLIEYLTKGNKGYREDGQALFQSPWSFHQADYRKEKKYDVLVVDKNPPPQGRAPTNTRAWHGRSMVTPRASAFLHRRASASLQDIRVHRRDSLRRRNSASASAFAAPPFRCRSSDAT